MDISLVRDIIGIVANGLTLAVAVGTVLLAFARRMRWFQKLVLGAPLRRAGRHVRRNHVHRSAGIDGDAFRSFLRQFQEAQLRAVLAEEASQPGALLAETMAHRQPADAIDGQPGWVAWSRAVHAYTEHARSLEASSLLARILYPSEARELRHALGAAQRHVSRFRGCEPVGHRAEGSTTLVEGSFAAFVTALSGAVVLVDAAASRARHGEVLLLWHSRRYRSREHPRDDGEGSYVAEHGTGGCSAWDTDERPPGDFDQRVLDLRSATLVEATTQGYLAVVLETAETCYATTELGAQIGCKHVSPSAIPDVTAPVVGPMGTVPSAVKVGDGTGRVVLLTAYVAVVSADQQLLLARRTGQVRHGKGTLSATAGGVVEPGAAGSGGDSDAFGMPDPLGCVLRETQEEIGLELEPEACRPVSVFLANIRGRTEETRDDGQLVGVVLYLAATDLTAAEVQLAAGSRADPARGAFEQDGLVCVPLSKPANVAYWTRRHARRLDQHGLLSALYVSAARFGHRQTRAAFEEAFAGDPWWTLSPYEDGAGRLVRPLETLMAGAGAFEAEAARR